MSFNSPNVISLENIHGALNSTRGVFTRSTKTTHSTVCTYSLLTPCVQFLAADGKQPRFNIPTIREYFIDLDDVLRVISDGPTKSFAFKRLRYLASKFTMYLLLNEVQEVAEMKVSSIMLTHSRELIVLAACSPP